MRESRKNILAETGLFHKIWRGHNREHVLACRYDKLRYLKSLFDTHTDEIKPQVRLYGYCVMFNHVHEVGQVVADENNDHTEAIKSFGDWMRNAHSRYGMYYNRKYDRQGKVAYDRPKTSEIQNIEEHLQRVMFYCDANPVRAGIVKHPSNYEYSSYKFYAFGKRDEYTEHLEMPTWYLKLGKTAKERQKKYRQLCDEYLRKAGYIDNIPEQMECRFIGDGAWQKTRKLLMKKTKRMRDGP